MATMSWDDGKHTKVKSVQLTFDDVIKSIEVAYEGTSLKSQQRGTVGTKSDGFTLSPDEYIAEVNGYYKTTFSGDVITSLTFKTNKRTYGTYGNKTRNYFSVTAPKDKQIVGFLGSSSHALNSIDAHFAPLGSTGGNTGETGSNAGNTNTTGTTGGTGSNTGNSTGGTGTDTGSNTGGNGSNTDGSNTGGTESNIGGTGTNIGSNTGDISNTDGSNTGGAGTNTGSNNGQTGSTTDNTGSNTGNTGTNTGSNIGGAGSNSGGTIPNTGGAGSNNGGTISNSGGTGTNTNDSESTGGTGLNTESGSNTDSSPQKLEAQGGKIGNQWDDGADHDDVTKIHVEAGGLGIEQVRFDYVKNGQSKEGPFHGVKGRGDSSTIVVNHPDEYLVSVEGWYDSSNIIQGIQFKTNTKTSPYFGYDFSGDGKQFSFQVKDKKIIGFHGFADSHLNSLGAYFVPISSSSSSLTPPPSKVLAQGGNYGEKFDDGAFDHVRKVYVGQGDSGVAYVKFDYEKDGNIETREHGKMTLLGTEDFEIDSDDYITSVEVYVDKVYGYKSEIVIALTFKTFKGKTSPRFGFETENKYEVKDGKGGKLAGFHGNASDVLYAIGAYFSPTTTSTIPLTPSAAKKLQAKGGNGGASWDDGVFDGVKKILVGQGTDGVAFVTFEYNKGSQAVIGDGHGKQTLLGTETFELDYPSEYITSVEGYYDKIFGVEAEVITNLTFKTNKRTSQPFGLTAGEHFELKEDGYKIVGFHGKASDVVHQIGVHVVPI